MVDEKDAGRMVRDARELAGLSQSVLAKASGRPTSWMSCIERGDTPCSPEQVDALLRLIVTTSADRHDAVLAFVRSAQRGTSLRALRARRAA